MWGKKQAGEGYVMLQAMFPTYLNTVASQVHPFMATLHPNSSGLFQQDTLQKLFWNSLRNNSLSTDLASKLSR